MSYAFDLSNHPGAATAIISSIPPDWHSVCGQLEAPPVMAVTGQVAAAGYLVDNWGVKVATLADHYDKSRFVLNSNLETEVLMYRREAHLELVGQAKAPLFVKFDEGGSNPDFAPLALETCKAIILTYLARGYGGNIWFRSRHPRDYHEGYDLPERLTLHLSPFETRQDWVEEQRQSRHPLRQLTFPQLTAAIQAGQYTLEEVEEAFKHIYFQHPPMVQFDWDSRYGGSEERLAPQLELCRQLGLPELAPSEEFRYTPTYTIAVHFD